MKLSEGYPFSAIVGQDELKLALILNAFSPEVGGVLVRGEKGTAKSTAVRALASLLPAVRVVSGCPYSCDPDEPNPACPAGPHLEDAPTEERPVRLVELPVGASGDRLSGTLDIETALGRGERSFEPGLLAAANRGILYVDEVNLLPDHLVDLLLDVAAMGVNRVEREGISVEHPSRFLLVGTMNPEEGELRPQLLDRFGLSVEVSGAMEVEERAEIVRRRLRYESDRPEFASEWTNKEREISSRVRKAGRRISEVALPDERLIDVSALCANLGVDGLRGDIVTAKTALALAAWEDRAAVSRDDVERAALLALAHRRRRGPFDEPGVTPEEIRSSLPEPPDDTPDGPGPPDNANHEESADSNGEMNDAGPRADGGARSEADDVPGSGERGFAPSGDFRADRFEVEARGEAGPSGRRGRTVGERGHPVGSRTLNRAEGLAGADVSVAATVRAAAPFQSQRERDRIERGDPGSAGMIFKPCDLRVNVREGREGNLVVFCVDASGSMAAKGRMGAVKGAAMEMLSDSYRSRDRVALVSFRGDGAKVLLPPTSSVDLASARLRELPTGGRTPLASGISEAERVVVSERRRDPARRPVVILLTDGRATSGPDPSVAAAKIRASEITSVVVDTEDSYVRLGLAGKLARAMGARCARLDEMSAAGMMRLVGETTDGTGRSVA